MTTDETYDVAPTPLVTLPDGAPFEIWRPARMTHADGARRLWPRTCRRRVDERGHEAMKLGHETVRVEGLDGLTGNATPSPTANEGFETALGKLLIPGAQEGTKPCRSSVARLSTRPAAPALSHAPVPGAAAASVVATPPADPLPALPGARPPARETPRRWGGPRLFPDIDASWQVPGSDTVAAGPAPDEVVAPPAPGANGPRASERTTKARRPKADAPLAAMPPWPPPASVAALLDEGAAHDVEPAAAPSDGAAERGPSRGDEGEGPSEACPPDEWARMHGLAPACPAGPLAHTPLTPGCKGAEPTTSARPAPSPHPSAVKRSPDPEPHVVSADERGAARAPHGSLDRGVTPPPEPSPAAAALPVSPQGGGHVAETGAGEPAIGPPPGGLSAPECTASAQANPPVPRGPASAPALSEDAAVSALWTAARAEGRTPTMRGRVGMAGEARRAPPRANPLSIVDAPPLEAVSQPPSMTPMAHTSSAAAKHAPGTASLDEIWERIQMTVTEGNRSSDIVVSTELGRVRIRVEVEAGTVSLQFAAEDAALKSAIQRGLGELTHSLAQRGFRMANISFDSGAGTGDGGGARRGAHPGPPPDAEGWTAPSRARGPDPSTYGHAEGSRSDGGHVSVLA